MVNVLAPFSQGFRVLLMLALCSAMRCATAKKYPVSDHYDGSVFFNTPPTRHLGFTAIAAHILFGRNNTWPGVTEPASNRETLPRLAADELSVTFIGHATLCIRSPHLTILTDPVWSERVGPASYFGPQRAAMPGISAVDLPRVTAVVISHNHYDHLDLPTLRWLRQHSDPVFFVPLGSGHLLADISTRVEELDWWQSVSLGPELKITFLPARHNSGRGLFDRDVELWGAYAIGFKAGYIYFAGDTAYGDHFSQTHARLGPPLAALLPIGAYEPRGRMREFHMNPAEAVMAHRDLGAPTSIGMHFGTFNLAAEAQFAPVTELKTEFEKSPARTGVFRALPVGASVVIQKSSRRKK